MMTNNHLFFDAVFLNRFELQINSHAISIQNTLMVHSWLNGEFEQKRLVYYVVENALKRAK
jgi:hypothetical protein